MIGLMMEVGAWERRKSAPTPGSGCGRTSGRGCLGNAEVVTGRAEPGERERFVVARFEGVARSCMSGAGLELRVKRSGRSSSDTSSSTGRVLLRWTRTVPSGVSWRFSPRASILSRMRSRRRWATWRSATAWSGEPVGALFGGAGGGFHAVDDGEVAADLAGLHLEQVGVLGFHRFGDLASGVEKVGFEAFEFLVDGIERHRRKCIGYVGRGQGGGGVAGLSWAWSVLG